MVSVRGQFCIDRFEVTLVDLEQGRALSPFYHPSVTHSRSQFRVWQDQRSEVGETSVQLLPIPEPPPFQLQGAFQPKAQSQSGAIPNGYMSGSAAAKACENAGKRLCTEDEWVLACRGEANTKFPYGNEYVQGACNVKSGVHPASVLHGHASRGHLDPRLNHFSYEGRPLLHRTGENQRCQSRWGDDAIYDMVGNLDEWIADEEGVFLGGFYARNTVEGCDARISSHPPAYFDYSLGTRCCR